MLSGDCNVCINGKLLSYSATCTECGLSRKNFKPITNADRIRSMSDEELARYLNSMQSLAYQNGVDVEPIRVYPNNYGAWIDWLRQEVTDG